MRFIKKEYIPSASTVFHKQSTGKSCHKMFFWVLFGLDKLVIDFWVAACGLNQVKVGFQDRI